MSEPTTHYIANGKLIIDDVEHALSSIPPASIHSIITSPPYFGLRDYHVDSEIGHESDPLQYVSNLVRIFRSCREVLRSDGTFWLNLGDSWVGSGRGPTGHNGIGSQTKRQGFHSPRVTIPENYKAKDMFGIPHLVVNALREDGWYVRQENIWVKNGSMPFSGRDRTTNAIEYVFLLTKSPAYYYNPFAVRQKGWEVFYHGTNELVRTSNLRNVWTITPDRYGGAHTAVFPRELVRRCMLLGSSLYVCAECATPYELIAERVGDAVNPREARRRIDATGGAITGGIERSSLGVTDQKAWQLLDYQRSCSCTEAGTRNAVILDPFVGSGTTAVEAYANKRDIIGIDLMPETIEMTESRYERQDGR